MRSGLRFSVPRDCNVLDWDRRGEWNVYPPDHIGRPRGTARAFPQVAQTVPPTCPWSQDVSPMGSNDFRSAKRHIYWAAIHYPDGPGVVVESNGRQHVRAMVQSDRTSVHVSDWYGGAGSASGNGRSTTAKASRSTRATTLTSTVRLRLSPQAVAPAKSGMPASASHVSGKRSVLCRSRLRRQSAPFPAAARAVRRRSVAAVTIAPLRIRLFPPPA